MDYKAFFDGGDYFDAVSRKKTDQSEKKPPAAKPEQQKPESGGKSEPPLAIAYVPMQVWQDLYEPEKGLSRGTVFAELDKPYIKGEVSYRGR